MLADLGTGHDLWRDGSGAAYAVVGRVSVPVKSKTFRSQLIRTYRDRTGKVPNSEALANALSVIESQALLDGPEDRPCVRVAHHAGRVYVHLADAMDVVIEISPQGWQPCDRPPVRFIRRAGMLGLPMPEPGGSLDDLRGLLNCPDDGNWVLLKAWMTSAMSGTGPFPLLVLTGEQGSAKSTTARMIKALLDPCDAPLRCEPREARDLMIGASRQHVLTIDNISRLAPWLSDALCRLATGGGFSTRELYTDAEEIVFDAMRPVILNGITDFVTRPDLLERSIVLRHPPIPESGRKSEAEIQARFDRLKGKIFGALLDRVAGMLRERPRVKLDRLPRMADFGLLAVAAERGAGEPVGFLRAYGAAQAAAEADTLEGDLVGAALLRWVPTVGAREGSAGELLAELVEATPEADRKSRGWPSSPRSLVEALKRLAPTLRRAGITYERGGNVGRADTKRAAHRLTWCDPKTARENPPHAPQAPQGQKFQELHGADGGAGSFAMHPNPPHDAPRESPGNPAVGAGGVHVAGSPPALSGPALSEDFSDDSLEL